MPAKRCVETKNMCLLFVDYCKAAFIPKGKLENGYSREKDAFIPKGKSGNGYRREKVTFIPKGKLENGYRREKRLSYPKESLKMGTGEKSVFHTQGKAWKWV